MGTVAIRFNEQRLDFPETAERTQTFLQKAQEAGKLEGAEKHFHVTANLAAVTALSFFNTLVYGARAIFESAYLAIWDRDEALENFNTQGLYALQSLSYVATGIFMTLGAIIVPDRVVAQIIQVEPPPPPPPPPPEPDPVEEFNKVKREFEEKVFSDNPQFLPMIQGLQGHIDLVQEDLPTLKSLLAFHIFVNGLEDQFGEILPAINEQYVAGQEKWRRVKEAVVAQQAFVPRPYGEDEVVDNALEFVLVSGALRDRIFPGNPQVQQSTQTLTGHEDLIQEDLPSLKTILAYFIYINNFEREFEGVFPAITGQYLEGRQNWRTEKPQLVFQKEVERIQEERRLEENRRILAEQAAALAEMDRLDALRPVERGIFDVELAAWDDLIARADRHIDELNAKVGALEGYERAWNALLNEHRRLSGFGGSGIDSKAALNRSIDRVVRNTINPVEPPEVTEVRVTADDYPVPTQEDFETIPNASDKRDEKVLEVTGKDETVNAALERIAVLEALKVKWDDAVKLNDSIPLQGGAADRQTNEAIVNLFKEDPS